ncbi:MAG: hypothetical protein JWN68_1498 [Nocardioides sp.]|jgi:hypothetical protein|nr:hypothetical protein [Nocardioides sp.]
MRSGCTAAAVLLVAVAGSACTSAEKNVPTSASASPTGDSTPAMPQDGASPPRLKDLDVGAKPKLA